LLDGAGKNAAGCLRVAMSGLSTASVKQEVSFEPVLVELSKSNEMER